MSEEQEFGTNGFPERTHHDHSWDALNKAIDTIANDLPPISQPKREPLLSDKRLMIHRYDEKNENRVLRLYKKALEIRDFYEAKITSGELIRKCDFDSAMKEGARQFRAIKNEFDEFVASSVAKIESGELMVVKKAKSIDHRRDVFTCEFCATSVKGPDIEVNFCPGCGAKIIE